MCRNANDIQERRCGTLMLELYATDAVQLDKSGEVAKSNQSPQSGTLVYPARVSLSKSIIQVDGKPVRLSPGMAVTAEIKTGTRRLIEFFLSPLLKSGQESLRER